MNRKTREELNELSKECFGSSSRWQKLVNNGVSEPFEREREVVVPRANGQLVKKTFKDKKSVVKRFTVQEVTDLMKTILATRKPTITSEANFPDISAPSVQRLEADVVQNNETA